MSTATRKIYTSDASVNETKLVSDVFYRQTQKALLDVDNKEIIDHSSIIAWANSLNSHQPKSPPFHENSMGQSSII